jgi:hypothetical protein
MRRDNFDKLNIDRMTVSIWVVQWLACLPLDPRFAGSNPAEDDGFLMVIKIHCATSFGGKVILLAPCCKILLHVREPYTYEKDDS